MDIRSWNSGIYKFAGHRLRSSLVLKDTDDCILRYVGHTLLLLLLDTAVARTFQRKSAGVERIFPQRASPCPRADSEAIRTPDRTADGKTRPSALLFVPSQLRNHAQILQRCHVS